MLEIIGLLALLIAAAEWVARRLADRATAAEMKRQRASLTAYPPGSQAPWLPRERDVDAWREGGAL